MISLTSGEAATIGLSIQIVGGVIAVYGLLSTWWAYSDGPPFPGLRRRVAAVASEIRSRLGIHRHVDRSATDKMPIDNSAAAMALIDWASLPADHEQALAEIHRRSRLLNKTIARVEQEGRDAIDAVRRDLGLGLAEEAKQRADAVRRLATRGVRIAMVGLVLVLVGTTFQWFAALWQAQAGN